MAKHARFPCGVHWSIVLALLLAGRLVAQAPAPSTQGEDSGPVVHLYGDATSLYLLQYARPGDEKFYLRLRARDTAQPVTAPGLDPFGEAVTDSGQVALGTAAAGGVHLFLSDGRHLRWGATGRSVLPPLSRPLGRGAVPVAVCPGPPPASLYAIGMIAAASQPATEPAGPALATAPAGEPRLGLQVLLRGQWQPAGALPDATFVAPPLLACDDQRLWLVGRTAGGWQVWKSTGLPAQGRHAATAPSSGPPPLRPVAWQPCPVPPELTPSVPPSHVDAVMLADTAPVGERKGDRLALVLRVPATPDGQRVNLRFLRLNAAGDRWADAATSLAREPDGQAMTFPAGATTVTAAGGQFAVAWVGSAADGHQGSSGSPHPVYYRVFGPDGQPAGPTTPLMSSWAGAARDLSLNALSLLSTVLMFGVLVGLFTWRREAFTIPVEPPPTLALATSGQRLLAFLVDFAPALLLAAVWLGQPGLDLLRRFVFEPSLMWQDLANLGSGTQDVLTRLAWRSCLVYAGLCLVSELTFGQTLGKRLLRLRVVTEAFAPPSTRQMLVRNVLRLLEFNPFTYFLLIVLPLSRNRQRVGDIVGRTLVVRPVAPDSEGPDEVPLARKVSRDPDPSAPSKPAKGPDDDPPAPSA